MKTTYQREHWRKWYLKDLLHVGYWPKYKSWQKEWVNADIKKIVGELADSGFTGIEWGGPENWFPVTAGILECHPAVAERDGDFYGEIVEECHRRGMKVLLGFSSKGTSEGKAKFVRKNWEVFKKQGIQLNGEDTVGHELCVHNRLMVDGIKEAVSAMCRKYPIDGVLIDFPVYRVSFDQETREINCDFCREAWGKFSGSPLVPEEDWNSAEWKQYVSWRQDCISDYLGELNSAVKSVDEKIFTTVNLLVRTVDSALHDNPNPDHCKGKVDNIIYESCLMSYGLMDVSMCLKLGRAITGTAAGCCLKNFELIFDGGWAGAKPSLDETKVLTYLGMIHGSWISFHSTMDENGEPHPLRTEVYRQTAKDISPELKDFQDLESAANAAILYSRTTRDFYASANPSAFLASFQGAEQVLNHLNIHSDYLLDSQITPDYLQKYKCLILPNTACMSDDQAAAIRQFVKDGGMLIASGETGLYDENEKFRNEFALSDVLGVKFNGVLDIARKIIGPERGKWKKQPFKLLDTHFIDDKEDIEIMQVPWHAVTGDKQSRILAKWCEVREGTNHASVNMGREIIGLHDDPCIVENDFGKGKSFYFSGDVFYNYSYRCLRFFQSLFKKIVVGHGGVDVYTDAPKSVETTVMKQEDKCRTIVHMVNLCNTNRWNNGMLYPRRNPDDIMRPSKRTDFPSEEMAEIAMTYRRKPSSDSTGPIDEILPVYGIKVYIKNSLLGNKKVILKGGKEIKPVTMEGDFAVFEIPELKLHNMLAIE
ncbi:MAG: hypothetical protein A2X48_13020 [Lentisphaerae bacterium GWF2_49_21]|nr:MAG: hypothetical protein A2X48_13020 [Lentisphaerae bacterium GWF2_49_21]